MELNNFCGEREWNVCFQFVGKTFQWKPTQNLLFLKESALNYKAILPNINLVGSEFELTDKYEFSGNSLKRGTVYI